MMTGASPAALRGLLIYGICLPLAIWLGYLLASGLDYESLGAIAIVLTFLSIPLLLRFHHVWLIASWNVAAMLFFLPGRPPLWLPLAGLSFGFAVLQSAMKPELRFIRVPGITKPLLLLALVIVVTMQLTGGLGLQLFGSGVYGGKRYVLLLGAIFAYFALTSRRIPPEKALRYVTLFFLGGATMAVGGLAGWVDPRFNFLFMVFPVESLSSLQNDVFVPDDPLARIGGMPSLSTAFVCTILVRYGMRDLFRFRGLWKLALVCGFTFLGLLGGFRSTVITVGLTTMVLLFMERMVNAKTIPIMVLVMLLGGGLLVGFVDRLPLSVQRSLAFLPIDIDPLARMSAESSSQWRLDMWRELLGEVPRYLLVGKGYAINPNELEMAQVESVRRGAGYEAASTAGDYHNGPLSVIIPLGLGGAGAFLWFVVSATRLLYRNYKFGDPYLQRINTFLFAYFIARLIFFMTVFGSFYTDMAVFAGLVGLSVSLNGGTASTAPQVTTEAAREPFRFAGVRNPAQA